MVLLLHSFIDAQDVSFPRKRHTTLEEGTLVDVSFNVLSSSFSQVCELGNVEQQYRW